MDALIEDGALGADGELVFLIDEAAIFALAGFGWRLTWRRWRGIIEGLL